jgi:hypothetical protein
MHFLLHRASEVRQSVVHCMCESLSLPCISMCCCIWVDELRFGVESSKPRTALEAQGPRPQKVCPTLWRASCRSAERLWPAKATSRMNCRTSPASDEVASLACCIYVRVRIIGSRLRRDACCPICRSAYGGMGMTLDLARPFCEVLCYRHVERASTPSLGKWTGLM